MKRAAAKAASFNDETACARKGSSSNSSARKGIEITVPDVAAFRKTVSGRRI